MLVNKDTNTPSEIATEAMQPHYSEPEIKALELVRSSLQKKGPFKAALLSGGLSGSNLVKVSTPLQDYVVRFWNMEYAEYFPQDLACQMIASDVGYGPKVYFANQAAGVSVIEYFELETFLEMPLRLQPLVELIRRIHTGPAVPKGIDKAKDLNESVDAVKKLNPRFLDLKKIREIQEAVYKATRPSANCVPCHRDLHPGNLIYNQKRFAAIDFTWGGMDDPYSDLATLAIFNCAQPEEEQFLLRLYLDREPTPEEIARLSLMKLPTKIFYGLEFLKLAPSHALSHPNPPSVEPKSYMRFGFRGNQPAAADYLEYAVSILNEVLEESQTEPYRQALALFIGSKETDIEGNPLFLKSETNR